MYWTSIIYLLTWPALVLLSYFFVTYVVRKYKKVLEQVEE